MNELQPIWRFVQRWWWLMLIPPAVAAALTLPTLLSRPVSGGYAAQFKYTAAMTSANVSPRDGDFQDVWIASEYTVNAFTEWVRGSSFRAEIQALLPDVDLAPLGIASDNARSIGQVQMSHPDAAALERIANAAITVLQTRNQAYFPHLGPEPATVTIIDAPVVVAAPPPLVNRFEPFIRVGLALIVGVLLAALAELSNQRVRDPADVEGAGVRLVGRIPRGRR
ncbi:hypothetical protein VZO05_02535 [Aggregatilineales bacterium SYSU G02658]